VIDGKQSVVWDEAENRMHVQKALMEYLLLGRIGWTDWRACDFGAGPHRTAMWSCVRRGPEPQQDACAEGADGIRSPRPHRL